MKKAFALVGAIALTLTPSTLTAENLIAKGPVGKFFSEKSLKEIIQILILTI